MGGGDRSRPMRMETQAEPTGWEAETGVDP
jgi:hypothetical protein